MKYNIILSSFVISLLAACGQKASQPSGSKTSEAAVDTATVVLTAEQQKNAALEKGTISLKDMHINIQVNGTIDVPPQNIVSVSIPLGGYLKKMDLMPGSRVSKGAVMATLEDPQYVQLQQDYLTAKAKLEFYQSDYNRQKTLNESKSTSDKVFQQVKADYESQRILMRALAEKLRLIQIDPDRLSEASISRSIQLHAPINAYVTKVNVNIGKYVNPSDVLFELVDPSDLHLSLMVFENDAPRLRLKQHVTFSVNNQPEKLYQASIHLISPSIDEDRTAAVHCDIHERNANLIPGTFVNATIQCNNQQVMALPQDAVIKWENNFYVFIESGTNTYQKRKVVLGNESDGVVEIKEIEGAPDRATWKNLTVVTKNAYTLLMKMKNGGEE